MVRQPIIAREYVSPRVPIISSISRDQNITYDGRVFREQCFVRFNYIRITLITELCLHHDRDMRSFQLFLKHNIHLRNQS